MHNVVHGQPPPRTTTTSPAHSSAPLLRLPQAEAGDKIYKSVKDEILQQFGPRDEDAFKKAMALKMTGSPSAFGKQLIHIICPGTKPMQSCHCARMIYGFWEAQLGAPIKSRLAGKKFSVTTYQDIFMLADEAWRANGGTSTSAVVAAVAETAKPSPSDTSSSTPQVAAFNQRGRGRGGRNNRGGRGRGGQNRGSYNNNSQNQNQSNSSNSSNPPTKNHQKGPKHADLPASAGWACAQHWKKGRGAPYCSDPLVCEWVNVVAPRNS